MFNSTTHCQYFVIITLDEISASSLASIAYNFATYRMVFGPNAEYGSVWGEYQVL